MTRSELRDILNMDVQALLQTGWLNRYFRELECDDPDDPDFEKEVPEKTRLWIAGELIQTLRLLADTVLSPDKGGSADHQASRDEKGNLVLDGWQVVSSRILMDILELQTPQMLNWWDLDDRGGDEVVKVTVKRMFEDNKLYRAAEALMNAADTLRLPLKDRSPFISKCQICGAYFNEEGTRKYCRECSSEAERLSNNRAQAAYRRRLNESQWIA